MCHNHTSWYMKKKVFHILRIVLSCSRKTHNRQATKIIWRVRDKTQHKLQSYNNAWRDKRKNIMPSHRLSLSVELLSKSVFNSLYAMVKSKSCVQSLSRFQSNLRVISKAFHSILSFPCIWLAGRPASGGRLLNCFLVSLLAIALLCLWEFTSCLLWLWTINFHFLSFIPWIMIMDHVSIHT